MYTDTGITMCVTIEYVCFMYCMRLCALCRICEYVSTREIFLAVCVCVDMC